MSRESGSGGNLIKPYSEGTPKLGEERAFRPSKAPFERRWVLSEPIRVEPREQLPSLERLIPETGVFVFSGQIVYLKEGVYEFPGADYET